jgi:hypothetical protein
MKRQLWLLALVAAVLLNVAPVLADDIYVIGGGGVGTRITSLPYTINSPGFYYLTGNLTYSGPSSSDGITVSSDDVTIDLMGFLLTGPGSSGPNGITVSGQKNVEVRNGSLSGWSNGLADFGGGLRNRALNLRVANCNYGINFEGSGSYQVKGCSVRDVKNGITCAGASSVSGNTVTNCPTSIEASGTISGNSVTNCSLFGIKCNDASNVIGNTVTTSGTPIGIYINTTAYCLVTQNTVFGPGNHFTPGTNTVSIANTNAGF